LMCKSWRKKEVVETSCEENVVGGLQASSTAVAKNKAQEGVGRNRGRAGVSNKVKKNKQSREGGCQKKNSRRLNKKAAKSHDPKIRESKNQAKLQRGVEGRR